MERVVHRCLEHGLAPRVAAPLLLALIGLLVWLAPYKSLSGYVPLIKPDAELTLRAHGLSKDITCEDLPGYEESGFTPSNAYTDEISKNDESADRHQRAYSTARNSRSTVILISPG
ncbi:MAG: hypothetical protein U1D55_04085 [Phycisphaerae bacterium]